MTGLGPDVDGAVLRHPAGRARSIGFHRVELAPAVLYPAESVYVDGRWQRRRRVLVPAVYVLECHACSALFRIGSPHLLDHHQAHRRRSVCRRVRAAVSLAGQHVRRALGKD